MSFIKELALIKRWIDFKILGRVKDQRVFVLDNFLPEKEFTHIKNIALQAKEEFFREKSSFRSGAALGLHELKKSTCSPIVDALIKPTILKKVQQRTKIHNLKFVSPEDRNQISLLYYRFGDGIDWHFDGNIYLGQRWAGIYTLHEKTGERSKLELEINKKMVTFKSLSNTLILFQADQIRHRVKTLLKDEERLVVNLLFSPNPEISKNPIFRFYQSMVNKIFYGKTDR
ncbi:hypothetical protein OAK75_08715 [Bacteriovoracales bacterium]|nr:hypothetical protein [Bacteriovoracales bacterium]